MDSIQWNFSSEGILRYKSDAFVQEILIISFKEVVNSLVRR